MKVAATFVLLAPLAVVADSECGSLQQTATTTYLPAVKAHNKQCPTSYVLGSGSDTECCYENYYIRQVDYQAAACCPCGYDCGNFFPSMYDWASNASEYQYGGRWGTKRLTLQSDGVVNFFPVTTDEPPPSSTLVTSTVAAAGECLSRTSNPVFF
jgi:hypothetical protein